MNAAPLLDVAGVVKDYAQLRAVDRVTFRLAPGQVVAILGPNGAGKSSLFRMLVGFMRPDQGHIRYLARDGRTHDSVLAAELGFMPEERGLYQDVKVQDVLAYFGQLRGLAEEPAHVQVTKILKELQIPQHAGKRVKELSKGNQQKVQLAACLVGDPRVLVLDEPFSGLDPINQESLLEYLGELAARGIGILLSAHHLQLVERVADHALILNRGAVVAEHHGRAKPLTQRVRVALADTPDFADAVAALVDAGGVAAGERIVEWDGDLPAAAAATVAALLRARAIASVTTGSPSLSETFFSALDGERQEAVP